MSSVYGVSRRPLGWGTKTLPSNSIVGITGCTRSGCTSTVPVPSATGVTSFMPTQIPLARDRATAWRLRSSASCTSPGKRIGMCRSTKRGVARARQGGRLGGRVVADDGHHAAVARRAGEHAVADRVAGSVEARRLAVPHADDAVVALVVERVDELAAHHRRRRQLLVEAGTDDDRQVGHGGRGGRRLLLERRDGRALVAGDERRRVQAAAAVDAQLVDGQAGEGLDAGEEDAAVLEAEAVGQLVRRKVRVVDRSSVSRDVPPSPHANSGVERLSMVMAPLVIRPVCRRPPGVACARSPRRPPSR